MPSKRRSRGRIRAARGAFVALPLLAAVACGDDDPGTGPDDGAGEPASLEATPATLTLHALGDSAQLTAVVRDARGNTVAGATVAWSNLDTAVATVGATGWVVARANGSARLVASSGALADTVAVVVQQVAAEVVVSPASLTLAEGDTARLTAAAVDSNGVAIAAPAFQWTSADGAVATVDGTGLVTAVRWGSETVITAAADGASGGATLTVLDQLAFVSFRDGNLEIYVMNADGSGQRRLTQASGIDDDPAWSPDGTKLAFWSTRDADDEIYVMNADGSGQTNLTNSDGYDAVPLWSPDGTKFVFSSMRDLDNEIYVMNADGSDQKNLTQDAGFDAYPAWSPDGSRIAFTTSRDGNGEVYVMAPDGSGKTNLTGSAGADYDAAWSPDGTKVVFVSNRDGNEEIYLMNADGSGEQRLTKADGDDDDAAWSPDGTKIVFVSRRDGNEEIYVMNADGSGQTRLTANDAGYDVSPAWSPDGTKIAFVTRRDFDEEIYVMNADGSGQANLTQNPGDDSKPAWRPRP